MRPTWQKINVVRHLCHWWHESIRRTISAMNLLMLILLVSATTGLLWAGLSLYETITGDGYGRRPAPRSHPDEEHAWQPPRAA
jgi:hypothetical protein